MSVPEESDNIERGYARLASAILLKAWLDLHEENRYAENARAFLAGPLAADLSRLLGLDPDAPKQISQQGGRLPQYLMTAREARAWVGRYFLEDKTRRGFLSALRLGGRYYYIRHEIESLARRAGIPVEKGQ